MKKIRKRYEKQNIGRCDVFEQKNIINQQTRLFSASPSTSDRTSVRVNKLPTKNVGTLNKRNSAHLLGT